MVYLVNLTPLVVAKLAMAVHQLSGAIEYIDGMEEVAIAAMEEGYLTSTSNRSYRYGGVENVFSMTDKGLEFARSARPEQVGGADFVSANGEDNAFLYLWFALLLKGGVDEDVYSSNSPLGRRMEMLHLASCGLDRSASQTPYDAQWSKFNGTFAENTQHSGLQGSATCNCGKIHDLEVCLEKEDLGIAGLMRLMMDPSSIIGAAPKVPYYGYSYDY